MFPVRAMLTLATFDKKNLSYCMCHIATVHLYAWYNVRGSYHTVWTRFGFHIMTYFGVWIAQNSMILREVYNFKLQCTFLFGKKRFSFRFCFFVYINSYNWDNVKSVSCFFCFAFRFYVIIIFM